MTVKIEIDQEKCIGAGQCVLAAPEVFDQRDDDGIVELLDGAPPESERWNSREAAQLCPAGAITVKD
jgi:ferredoxin